MADDLNPMSPTEKGEVSPMRRQERGYSRLKTHEAQLRNQLQPPVSPDSFFEEMNLPPTRRPVYHAQPPKVRIPDALKAGNLRSDRSDLGKKKKFMSDMSSMLPENARDGLRMQKPGQLPPINHDQNQPPSLAQQNPSLSHGTAQFTASAPNLPSTPIKHGSNSDAVVPKPPRQLPPPIDPVAAARRRKNEGTLSRSAPSSPGMGEQTQFILSGSKSPLELERSPIQATDAWAEHDSSECLPSVEPGKLNPSERIGCFYTLSAYGMNVKRMLPCNIAPNTLINPPLTENIMGVDLSQSPNEDNGYLPLESFDLPGENERSPKEWIQFLNESNLGAKTKFLKGTTWVWKPCKVVSYDAVENAYIIEWTDTGKRKFVSRLNLMFDTESEQEFDERVKQAIERRKKAEADLRLQMYLDDSPTDEIPPMAEDSITRINSLCGITIPQNNLQDIRAMYISSMKRAIFNYNFMNPLERQRLQPFKFPDPPFRPGAPFSGVVPTADYKYASAYSIIQDRLFRSDSLLLGILLQVTRIWEPYSTKVLIDNVMAGQSLPAELKEIVDYQTRHADEVVDVLLKE